MHSKRTELEYEALASSLRVQLRCFQQKLPVDDNILAELHRSKRYLKFKLAKAAYDAAHALAITKLEAARHAIIEEALRNFDIQEKEIQEVSVWGWSPLYQILKLWPIPNMIKGPWEHSEHEWSKFESIFIENMKDKPTSLENDCPHIVKVVKFIFHNMYGRSRPLAHSARGLIVDHICSFTNDVQCSLMMTNAATFIEKMGWTLYPSQSINNSDLQSMHIDILNLLRHDVDLQ
jgi:hypothetical protein